MISEYTAYAYCCEDVSKIENYDKAIADMTQTWICHHRREILDNGEKVYLSELKRLGLYYHRPASELIFLTKAEHNRIHSVGNVYHKNKPHSAETRKKMSETRKGRKTWNKGIPLTEEIKRKMSETKKGRKFFNNGVKAVWARECPDGFKPGRLPLKKR